LFQAPYTYGSPQFSNNPDPDISSATLRVVDPPNSAGNGNNPFLALNNRPYQENNLLAAQSQALSSPSVPTPNHFTPGSKNKLNAKFDNSLYVGSFERKKETSRRIFPSSRKSVKYLHTSCIVTIHPRSANTSNRPNFDWHVN
jgi:hypothetical protein